MSQPLLSRAFDEAQHASDDVRAAAYLHIARVLCRFDPPKAQALVDQAIALVDTLSDDAKAPMQSAAIALAATVSPATAFRLIKASRLDEHRASGALSMALFNMMSHGFSGDAIEFLSTPFDEAAFPFEAAMAAKNKSVPPPTLPSPTPSTPEDAVVSIGHHAIPVAEAIATGFKAVLDHARQLHVADSAADNGVPCECWPSTSEFRAILHAAGEVDRQNAEQLIDRVPAGPGRLLASIELAAALAGLPRLGGATMSPRPRRNPAPPPVSFASGASGASGADLPPGWPPKPFEPLPPARKPNRPPSLEVHISPTTKADGARPSGGCGSDFWAIEGVRLGSVIARLCDTPETRVTLPAALAAARYDFVLVLPTDATQQTMTRLMRSGIERHFGVVIEQQPRLTTALVLSAPEGLRAAPGADRGQGGLFAGSVSWTSTASGDDGAEAGSYDLDAIFDMQMAKRDVPLDQDGYLQKAMKRFARLSGGHRGRGRLTGITQDMTMAALCELLESSLGQPVVDETSATGTYALKVESDGETTARFLEALWEQTGLTLTAAPREVPMVVVQPTEPRR